MANGYRVTAIVLMVIGSLVALGGFANLNLKADTILQQQYYQLAVIQTTLQGMFFTSLAICFLLLERKKDKTKA